MKFKKVYIEITNKCNLNCTFCSETKREMKEMSIEDFKKVAKEVKKISDYVYLHIKGEPLIHSNIDEIVRICKDNELFVNLTTNGTMIEKNIELFKNDIYFRQVNISLHAYKNIKSINKLINLIDDIRKENKKTYFVYRYWTVDEKNEEYLELIELLKEKYNLDVCSLNTKLDKNLYLNRDFEFTWPSLDNDFYQDKGTCLGLKTHLGILSDGTVVPCCLDCEGIINLGNILENNIEDILKSERVTKIISGFKNNIKIEELCKHCSFKI